MTIKKSNAAQYAPSESVAAHQVPRNISEWMSETYPELRRIAAQYFHPGNPDQTLQRTALIHETFIRLTRNGPDRYANRAHFFGVIARSMRQVMVEHARRRLAQKRGRGWQRVAFEELDTAGPEALDFLALDEALKHLKTLDPKLCGIVELRFFAGLSIQETASILKRGESTIRRDWTIAKVWLQRELAH